MVWFFFLFLLLSFSISFNSELDRLLRLALRENPKIKWYENKIKSFEFSAKFYQSLPNPYFGFSITSPSGRLLPYYYEPMSGYRISISQRFILPLKRYRLSQVERAKGELLREELLNFKKQLEVSLKVNYYRYQYSFLVEDELMKIVSFLKKLREKVREDYRYGRANLSEILFLDSQILSFEEELYGVLRERKRALYKIYSLVGKRVEVRREEPEVCSFPEYRLSPKVLVVASKRELERRKLSYYEVLHLPDFTFSSYLMLRVSRPSLLSLGILVSVPIYYKGRELMKVLESKERLLALSELLNYQERVSLFDYKSLREQRSELLREVKALEEEIRKKEEEIKAINLLYSYKKETLREVVRTYTSLFSLKLKLLKLKGEVDELCARASYYY